MSVGHTTLVATVLFFGEKELREMAGVKEEADSSLSSSTATLSASSLSHHSTLFPQIHFDYDQEYLFQDHLVGSDERMITKFGTIMLIIRCICIYMYASSLHILLFKCTYIYECDQVCIFSSTYLQAKSRYNLCCYASNSRSFVHWGLC